MGIPKSTLGVSVIGWGLLTVFPATAAPAPDRSRPAESFRLELSDDRLIPLAAVRTASDDLVVLAAEKLTKHGVVARIDATGKLLGATKIEEVLDRGRIQLFPQPGGGVALVATGAPVGRSSDEQQQPARSLALQLSKDLRVTSILEATGDAIWDSLAPSANGWLLFGGANGRARIAEVGRDGLPRRGRSFDFGEQAAISSVWPRANGELVVAGSVRSDAWIATLAPDLSVVWSRTYRSKGRCRFHEVLPIGNLFVAFGSIVGRTGATSLLAGFDATGGLTWARNTNEILSRLALTASDDSLLLAYHSALPSPDNRILELEAVNAATGQSNIFGGFEAAQLGTSAIPTLALSWSDQDLVVLSEASGYPELPAGLIRFAEPLKVGSDSAGRTSKFNPMTVAESRFDHQILEYSVTLSKLPLPRTMRFDWKMRRAASPKNESLSAHPPAVPPPMQVTSSQPDPGAGGQTEAVLELSRQASTLLRDQKFTELDQLGSALRREAAVWPSGDFKIFAFDRGLSIERTLLAGLENGEYLSRFDAWLAAIPGAKTRFGRALALQALAWKARGHAFANRVSDQGHEDFARWIAEANRELTAIEKELSGEPDYWTTRLQVAVAAGASSAVLDSIWDRAVEKVPRCLEMHLTRASAHLPRWGGETGDVELFAAAAADRTKRNFGDEVYARVAGFAFESGEFESGERFDWARVRRGILESVARHPSSNLLVQRYARLALAANDLGTARELLRLPIATWDADAQSVWPKAKEFEAIRLALKATPADPIGSKLETLGRAGLLASFGFPSEPGRLARELADHRVSLRLESGKEVPAALVSTKEGNGIIVLRSRLGSEDPGADVGCVMGRQRLPRWSLQVAGTELKGIVFGEFLCVGELGPVAVTRIRSGSLPAGSAFEVGEISAFARVILASESDATGPFAPQVVNAPSATFLTETTAGSTNFPSNLDVVGAPVVDLLGHFHGLVAEPRSRNEVGILAMAAPAIERVLRGQSYGRSSRPVELSHLQDALIVFGRPPGGSSIDAHGVLIQIDDAILAFGATKSSKARAACWSLGGGRLDDPDSAASFGDERRRILKLDRLPTSGKALPAAITARSHAAWVLACPTVRLGCTPQLREVLTWSGGFAAANPENSTLDMLVEGSSKPPDGSPVLSTEGRVIGLVASDRKAYVSFAPNASLGKPSFQVQAVPIEAVIAGLGGAEREALGLP